MVVCSGAKRNDRTGQDSNNPLFSTTTRGRRGGGSIELHFRVCDIVLYFSTAVTGSKNEQEDGVVQRKVRHIKWPLNENIKPGKAVRRPVYFFI